MLERDDVAVSRAGHINITLGQSTLDDLHLETLHRGLQSADRVDLRNDDPGSVRTHRTGAALADIAVTANDHHLAGNHHVGRPLDTVRQRLAATVQVVEFRLGAGVVHVDRRNEQFARLLHLIKAMHAGRRFFAHTPPLGYRSVPFAVIFGQNLLQRIENDLLLVRRRFVIQRRSVVFGLVSFVDQQRGIAAVIDDQLRALPAGERHGHRRTPPVLGQRFALPRKDGNPRFGDGRRRMVLRRKNIARAPAHVGAQLDQRFDQHGGLNRHMQRPHDTHALQRFLRAVLAAYGHQSGHLVLRNLNLFPAPFGQ